MYEETVLKTAGPNKLQGLDSLTYRQIMYKHCTLRNGNTWYHAWVPEQFAVKGKHLQFKDDNEGWGTLWEVVSTGDMSLSGDYIRELERDHLHQRKASDI